VIREQGVTLIKRINRLKVKGHSPAVRRSQARASSSPPPRAAPSIAAMVGMGIDAVVAGET
jgi:hypothetical protein